MQMVEKGERWQMDAEGGKGKEVAKGCRRWKRGRGGKGMQKVEKGKRWERDAEGGKGKEVAKGCRRWKRERGGKGMQKVEKGTRWQRNAEGGKGPKSKVASRGAKQFLNFFILNSNKYKKNAREARKKSGVR